MMDIVPYRPVSAHPRPRHFREARRERCVLGGQLRCHLLPVGRGPQPDSCQHQVQSPSGYGAACLTASCAGTFVRRTASAVGELRAVCSQCAAQASASGGTVTFMSGEDAGPDWRPMIWP